MFFLWKFSKEKSYLKQNMSSINKSLYFNQCLRSQYVFFTYYIIISLNIVTKCVDVYLKNLYIYWLTNVLYCYIVEFVVSINIASQIKNVFYSFSIYVKIVYLREIVNRIIPTYSLELNQKNPLLLSEHS